MSSTALYTDLSSYYDLMCADINYQEQSDFVRRMHQLFGNTGDCYLDLACGTGPHIRHFIDYGYSAQGVDINQPMLDIAKSRCPEASFIQQDMSELTQNNEIDLVSCFLYSIHYNQNLEKLSACINSVHRALKAGGVFCFNSVDKNHIDNRIAVKHYLNHEDSKLSFQSGWYYSGTGNQQSLKICIEKTTNDKTTTWTDQHTMVATSFKQLLTLLAPYFEVEIFEHNYQTIEPWQKTSGNAIFVCIKK